MFYAEYSSAIEYLARRLVGIVDFQHVIKEVTIFVSIDDVYGREYARICFNGIFDEAVIKELPQDQLARFSYLFSDFYSISGSAFASFLINDDRAKEDGSILHHDKISKLNGFYDCYTFLSAFVVEFCSLKFGREFPIRIQNIESEPEFKYARLFRNSEQSSEWEFKRKYGVEFDTAIRQHRELHSLSRESLAYFSANPTKFCISDRMISNLRIIQLGDIRDFLITNKIPIHFEEPNILWEIQFDYEHFLNCCKIADNSMFNHYYDLIEVTISKNIDEITFANRKRSELIKKSRINIGDIVLLDRDRLVAIDKIKIDYGKIIPSGFLLKNDLSKGKRYISLTLSEVTKAISNEEYQEIKCKHRKLQKAALLYRMSRRRYLPIR